MLSECVEQPVAEPALEREVQHLSSRHPVERLELAFEGCARCTAEVVQLRGADADELDRLEETPGPLLAAGDVRRLSSRSEPGAQRIEAAPHVRSVRGLGEGGSFAQKPNSEVLEQGRRKRAHRHAVRPALHLSHHAGEATQRERARGQIVEPLVWTHAELAK